MTTETQTWTPWLKNPGDGVCPVPEWNCGYEVLLIDGDELTANENSDFSWYANDPLCIEITHYRYAVPEDLAWLAREVSEWHKDLDLARRGTFGPEFFDSSYFPAREGYTKAQWIRTRQDLSLESLDGKPSWDDAPEWAEWLAQDEDGRWFFYGVKPTYGAGCWGAEEELISASFFGQPQGDWRNTLERRPQSVPEVTPEEEEERQAKERQLLGKRNKYQREIKPGIWVDVYDVLQAWGVQNPAIQHLIKKALQPGERGHKDKAQDMDDIVASALRARELEAVK